MENRKCIPFCSFRRICILYLHFHRRARIDLHTILANLDVEEPGKCNQRTITLCHDVRRFLPMRLICCGSRKQFLHIQLRTHGDLSVLIEGYRDLVGFAFRSAEIRFQRIRSHDIDIGLCRHKFRAGLIGAGL